MTEEVTDALDEVERLARLNPIYEGFKDQSVGLNIRTHVRAIAASLAKRSASNSPTTNGEGAEPRQTHCADPDCTGPKPHVAEAAGCKWGNPRAASDDEVEKLLILIETADEHGDECAIVEQAARVRAALSTPTKASADDDPETAKGEVEQLLIEVAEELSGWADFHNLDGLRELAARCRLALTKTAKGGACGPAPAPNEAAWPAGFISIDALMNKVLTANDLVRLSCNCCQTPHLKDCWIAALTNHSDLTEGKK